MLVISADKAHGTGFAVVNNSHQASRLSVRRLSEPTSRRCEPDLEQWARRRLGQAGEGLD